MAVISVRLNEAEEKMVNFLSDYYDRDRSALIKYSLMELYEDIIDVRAIDEFEVKEKSGKVEYFTFDETLAFMKE